MTPNIFPALRYDDARGALEFFAKAFGFEETFSTPGEDGTVSHAEMRYGSGTLMFGSTAGGTVPAGIYAVVDDIDAHYQRAVAAGAAIVYELADTDYGSREYGARDPEGHHWFFGTYLPDAPPGAATLIPSLRYRDPSAGIGFLTEALGFRETFSAPGEDGAIAHAELRLGDGWIMLGTGDPAAGVSLYVVVDDVDAHHDRARAAGAEIVRSPADTPYGSRDYGARDPEGHEWWFGTYRPA